MLKDFKVGTVFWKGHGEKARKFAFPWDAKVAFEFIVREDAFHRVIKNKVWVGHHVTKDVVPGRVDVRLWIRLDKLFIQLRINSLSGFGEGVLAGAPTSQNKPRKKV